MKLLLMLMYSAVLIVSSANSQAEIKDCAVRFKDNGVCACSTHNTDGPIKSSNNSQKIQIQPCYCAYYDQHLNKTTVGSCY